MSVNDGSTSSATSSSSSAPMFSGPPPRAHSEETLLQNGTNRQLTFGDESAEGISWLKNENGLVHSTPLANGLSTDETDSVSKKGDPTDSSQRERLVDSTKERQCDSSSSASGQQRRRDEAVRLSACNVSRLVYGGRCKWAWKRKLKPIHYRSGGGDSVWFI